MNPTLLQAVLTSAAVISAACALFVAWRAGKWKAGDELKNFDARLSAAESSLQMHDLKFIGLPSAADIAGLRAEIRNVGLQVEHAEKLVERAEKSTERVERSVDRIESFLMEGRRS